MSYQLRLTFRFIHQAASESTEIVHNAMYHKVHRFVALCACAGDKLIAWFYLSSAQKSPSLEILVSEQKVVNDSAKSHTQHERAGYVL